MSIHISYPRISIDCKEDPFEYDVKFRLLVEAVHVCTCGDLVTTFALMFATYYIYNLSYADAIQSTMTFLQTAFLKIEDGVKKGLQSVKINDNLIECLNLHKFEKFVQIVK